MKLQRVLDLWRTAMRDQGHELGSVQTLRLLWYLFRSLPLAPRALWRKRMLKCQRCALYRRKTRQCGSHPVGCGCSMPLKALLRGSECWAREQGEDFGW